MRRIAMLLTLLTVMLSPNIANTKIKVSLTTFQEYHDKYAVTIAAPLDGKMKDFCSGIITNRGIVTAAHCCAVSFVYQTVLSYSKDGEEYKGVTTWENDTQGQDICIITPAKKEYSPIKLGDLPQGIDGIEYKINYINISKIGILYTKEDLKKYEIQNVWLLGPDYRTTDTMLFAGYGMPGMSGSGIFDTNGRLVGVLTVGLLDDNLRRESFIPGVFGASTIELSQWSPSSKIPVQ